MRNLTQAPLNPKSVYFNGFEIAAAVFFSAVIICACVLGSQLWFG